MCDNKAINYSALKGFLYVKTPTFLSALERGSTPRYRPQDNCPKQRRNLVTAALADGGTLERARAMGKPLCRRRLCIRKGTQLFPRVLQRAAAEVRPRSGGRGRRRTQRRLACRTGPRRAVDRLFAHSAQEGAGACSRTSCHRHVPAGGRSYLGLSRCRV